MSDSPGEASVIPSSPNPQPSPAPSAPAPDPVLDRFRDDLRASQRPSHLGVRALLLLATAAAFAWSMREQGISGLLILGGVLLLHECGHLAAMRWFGYRNLNMFFLPFFGAAVTGKPTVPSSWQEGVVSLAGPVPGLVLGLALLPLASRDPLWQSAVLSLVFINGLNLLPLAPLDGGRLVGSMLFSRSYALDVAATIVGSVGFAILLFQSFPSGVAPGLTLGLLINRLRLIDTANSVRSSGRDFSAPIEELSDGALHLLRRYAEDRTSSTLFGTRRAAASYAIALHDLVRLRVATWPQTIALLLVWAAAGSAAWVTWDRYQHPRAEWHVVEDPDGRWSAEFPATVTVQRFEVPGGSGTGGEASVARLGHREFGVTSVPLSVPAGTTITNQAASQILDASERGMATNTRSTLADSEHIVMLGHRARAVQLAVDGKSAGTARILVGNAALYMMMVAGPADQALSQRFFDSLRLHEPEAATPPPRPGP